MQSTPSRTRHSRSIFAPLINVDISFYLKKSLANKKGHQPGCLPPGWHLELSSCWPSSGAGYDDLKNNNAYRNNACVGNNGPACEIVGHRRTKIRVYPTSFPTTDRLVKSWDIEELK